MQVLDIEITQKGRPRDVIARDAVLDAALSLAAHQPLKGLTIDAISKRSGVSRPTIYRWWNGKGEIVLEALLNITQRSAPYSDTDDVVADVVSHALRYSDLLQGLIGSVYRAIFAEALADPKFRILVQLNLIEPRRAETRRVLEAALKRGQFVETADVEALIDALYAPFLFRLMIGHGPIDAAFAIRSVEQVLKGVLLIGNGGNG